MGVEQNSIQQSTIFDPMKKDKKSIKANSGLINKMKKQKYLLLLITPCLLYYVIFKYVPMYGIIISFKDFNFMQGIMESPWAGTKYFEQFLNSPFLFRLLKNTILLSVYSLFWGFPIPIIFALFLNELSSGTYKRVVQTISYLPHFISVTIVVGLMKSMLSPNSGIINKLIEIVGGTPINFFMETGWFRTLYVTSGIWQSFGWGAIIYLATIASIDTSLYEAARIDGAGRFKCMWHITLPGIRPTIIVLLLLRLGNMLDIGFEKVLLMYNPGIYEVSDVISTYVFRSGIQNANYSFGTAVGLMESVISLILVVSANYLSRRYSESSLW